VHYWRQIAAQPKIWEDYIGASLATCFNASSRVVIQQTMEKFRKALLQEKSLK
jgi:hypothetical protein